MTHPPASYLTVHQLDAVLELARVLRRSAHDVGRLVDGAGGVPGRIAAAEVAVTGWIGPHRRTFDAMIAGELDTAARARARMEDEADAWAAFWARAVDARNRRLHDEAETPRPAPPEPVAVPIAATDYAPTG